MIMSKELHEDMLWQEIEREVLTEDEEGLLEEEIFSYSRIGLHADDDRDEILYEIIEQRFRERCV
tara:strand:- start:610 stop:804 length:195 start_codon:yes stop_codon:yes gene_type:complete